MESSVEDKKIRIRASACQQCETCTKKERYQVVPVTKELPNPTIVLMAASPLAVMIKEVKTTNHLYLLYRCQDPMCLLANSKESIAQYFLADQRRKMVTLQQQTNRNQRKYGKKRDRRKGKKR